MEKYEKLISKFKDFANDNKNLNVILTGSLSILYNGFLLNREPKDIDIIIYNIDKKITVSNWKNYIKIPEGSINVNIKQWGFTKYIDRLFFINDDVLYDIFFYYKESDYIKNNDGIYYQNVNHILELKEKRYKRLKDFQDIEYIKKQKREEN